MSDFTTTNGDGDTDPTTVDPGIAGAERTREADSARAEATRTTRELGRNSNGDAVLYPSDREALMRQYGLTAPEAEMLWDKSVKGDGDMDSTAEEIKSGRVYYRQSYEQVPADATVVPGAAPAAAGPTDEEIQKQEDERKRLQEAANAPTTDTTQPEAGQWGPYADYRKVEKSPEEVSSTTELSVEEAEKVLEGEPASDGDDDLHANSNFQANQ